MRHAAGSNTPTVTKAGQVGALVTLGYGVCLWLAGLFIVAIGALLPGPLGLVQLLWLPLLVAAAVMGVRGAAHSMKVGTWPLLVLFPVGILLVMVSGLGVIAPLAM
jgi:hypothetical protein